MPKSVKSSTTPFAPTWKQHFVKINVKTESHLLEWRFVVYRIQNANYWCLAGKHKNTGKPKKIQKKKPKSGYPKPVWIEFHLTCLHEALEKILQWNPIHSRIKFHFSKRNMRWITWSLHNVFMHLYMITCIYMGIYVQSDSLQLLNTNSQWFLFLKIENSDCKWVIFYDNMSFAFDGCFGFYWTVKWSGVVHVGS